MGAVVVTRNYQISLVERTLVAAGGGLGVCLAPLRQNRQRPLQRRNLQQTNVRQSVHLYHRHGSVRVRFFRFLWFFRSFDQLFHQLLRGGLGGLSGSGLLI